MTFTRCVCVCVCVRAQYRELSYIITHKYTPHKKEENCDDNQCLYSSEDLMDDWLIKLVSHWDATISRLVGDKGLRYKCAFFYNFHKNAVTLDFVITTDMQLY